MGISVEDDVLPEERTEEERTAPLAGSGSAETSSDAGSGWFIQGIELPEAPKTENKSISRSFLQEDIYKNYAAIYQPTTSSYSYTLTGYIYGDIVNQLEALAKSADTEIVTVVPPTERLKSTKLNAGLYVFSNFTATRNRYVVTESK